VAARKAIDLAPVGYKVHCAHLIVPSRRP
jgi:hypothetical protein